LWKHFKKWGDVREVFIAKQRNRNGRRYGFVRFKGVEDEYLLERQLYNVIIEGLKLYVNLPRYERLRGGQVKLEEKKQEQGHGNKNEDHRHIQRGERIKQSSYAEAVTGKARMANGEGGMSSIYLEPTDEMRKWLSEACIGRLTKPASFNNAEDELRWDYGMDISAKYLGDDMVLIFGLNEERAECLLTEVSHNTLPMFYSLQPSLHPGHRMVWVQCWGIPALAWEAQSIKKIVGVMGELVEMNEDTEERRRMDRARVLIKTPWKPRIQHTVKVHIDSEMFEVRILEESGPNIDLRQGRGRGEPSPSDEIDSDDSLMASPASKKTEARAFESAVGDKELQPYATVRRWESSGINGDGADGNSSTLPSGQDDMQDPASKVKN